MTGKGRVLGFEAPPAGHAATTPPDDLRVLDLEGRLARAQLDAAAWRVETERWRSACERWQAEATSLREQLTSKKPSVPRTLFADADPNGRAVNPLKAAPQDSVPGKEGA